MIDDDSFDMKQINRLWKFVHTKTNQWLTEDKMNECIEILNGSVEPILNNKLVYLGSNERNKDSWYSYPKKENNTQ